MAGISGNPIEGAWSIALSGGYPDDVDLGVAFTYTGCGGRDLKGTRQNPKNLRTAEQTSHQSFDWPLNAAIKVCPAPCSIFRLMVLESCIWVRLMIWLALGRDKEASKGD